MHAFYAKGWYNECFGLKLNPLNFQEKAVKSYEFRIANVAKIPWKFQIEATDGEACTVHLKIDDFRWMPFQAIEVDFEVLLKNRFGGEKRFSAEKRFSNTSSVLEVSIPEFSEFLQNYNGYLVDGHELKFTLAVGITNTVGIEAIEMLDLSRSDPMTNDYPFTINETTYYVCKPMLTLQSEKLGDILESPEHSLFDDCSSATIHEFLQMVHGIDLSIHFFNVREMLRLAHILQVPRVIERCKLYLIHGLGDATYFDRVEIADNSPCADDLWEVFPRMLASAKSLAELKAQNWNCKNLSGIAAKRLAFRVFQLTNL